MKASELPAQPRCTVICKDTDSGAIVRCALWHGHVPEDEHIEYQEVIQQMCEALAAINGTEASMLSMSERIIIVTQAEYWYRKLVQRV